MKCHSINGAVYQFESLREVIVINRSRYIPSKRRNTRTDGPRHIECPDAPIGTYREVIILLYVLDTLAKPRYSNGQPAWLLVFYNSKLFGRLVNGVDAFVNTMYA